MLVCLSVVGDARKRTFRSGDNQLIVAVVEVLYGSVGMVGLRLESSKSGKRQEHRNCAKAQHRVTADTATR